MKSKAELIRIANLLDYSNDYEKFYEFAKKYIMYMKASQKNDKKYFFSTINLISKNAKDYTIKNALGIESKHNKVEAIKEWCKHISESEELKQLELDELHYVLGYATRKAKILKSLQPEDDETSKCKPNKRPKEYKNNNKDEKPNTVYKSKSTNKIKAHKSLKGKVTEYRNNAGKIIVGDNTYIFGENIPKETNIIKNYYVIIDLNDKNEIINIRKYEENA
ncbi:MAG: hypothetical protein GX286_07935 [Clostridiales bacterium]|nr:hypothetical protein [Clostridiales bacterium]